MADTVFGGSNRPLTFLWLFNFFLILLASCLCFVTYLLSSQDRPRRIEQPSYSRMEKSYDEVLGVIPKRLHQTYVSRHVPVKYAPFIKSWAINHPKWEYWFWSNQDGRAFIRDKYPKYLKMYDKLPDDLQRSDVLRYFILYHYGGVYADMDMEVYKPIDSVISNYTCFFSQEQPIDSILLYNLTSIPMNALMGSIQHHDFFRYVLHKLPQQQKKPRRFGTKNDATEITGPLMLQKAISDYRAHISTFNDIASIVPNTFFMPNIDLLLIPILKNQKCKRKHMSPPELKACRDLEKYLKLSPKERIKGAYGDHKLLHLGYRKKMVDRKTVDVYSLFPRVFRYTPDASGGETLHAPS